jgi:hypothetical protein
VTDEPPPGPNPVGLLFRHVVQKRLRELVAPGSSVLDVRHGTGAAGALFDGAYAGPGTLDDADLGALGRNLAAALRPGAPVLLCLGPRGRPPRRLRPREARARLGPDFVWHGAFALGVLVPGESRQGWVRGHPQAFGLLAALEGVVRRWPLLRALGDYVALEGARR